jgi:putative aldouronate transport system substrate-binding protein
MTGWIPVMISKNVKDPKRAIRFLTYLASEEGQKDIFLGKKGETWDTIDGKDQLLPDVLKAYEEDQTAFGQKYGAVDTYWQMRNPVIVSQWRPAKIAPVQQMVDWANKHADFTKVYAKDLDPLGNSPEGVAFSKIQQEFGQTLPKLITAKSEDEFDKLWNKFIDDRKGLNFDLVQQYRQKQLDTLKAKLAD